MDFWLWAIVAWCSIGPILGFFIGKEIAVNKTYYVAEDGTRWEWDDRAECWIEG